MRKQDVVEKLLAGRRGSPRSSGDAFASSNIALCKYWGKRDEELNLPVTSSLSISLGRKGTYTQVTPTEGRDRLYINYDELVPDAPAARRVEDFLTLLRGGPDPALLVRTTSNIPMAAGLASSASAFAALVQALNVFFGWALDPRALSILARLGSGSASRSLFPGFVEWHAGGEPDGMDSYAEPLPHRWPSLRIGIFTVSRAAKPIGSRPAMLRTRETSRLYASWPAQAADDLEKVKTAIAAKNFPLLGETAETNALSMHATMISAWPPVLYWLPETVQTMRRIWSLREQGLPVYFTMDAGPNLKLLFEREREQEIRAQFPGLEIVDPWGRGDG